MNNYNKNANGISIDCDLYLDNDGVNFEDEFTHKGYDVYLYNNKMTLEEIDNFSVFNMSSYKATKKDLIEFLTEYLDWDDVLDHIETFLGFMDYEKVKSETQLKRLNKADLYGLIFLYLEYKYDGREDYMIGYLQELKPIYNCVDVYGHNQGEVITVIFFDDDEEIVKERAYKTCYCSEVMGIVKIEEHEFYAWELVDDPYDCNPEEIVNKISELIKDDYYGFTDNEVNETVSELSKLINHCHI